jgi:hypothetical protein
MSAAEIIEPIKALPQDERAEVFEYVRELAAGTAADTIGVRNASATNFDGTVNRVFEKHDELFRALAE